MPFCSPQNPRQNDAPPSGFVSKPPTYSPNSQRLGPSPQTLPANYHHTPLASRYCYRPYKFNLYYDFWAILGSIRDDLNSSIKARKYEDLY